MPTKTTALALAAVLAVLVAGCGKTSAPQASTPGHSNMPTGPMTGPNGEVISQAEVQREVRKTEAEDKLNEARQAREYKAQQAREQQGQEEGPAIEREEREAKREREADGVVGSG
jgi:hypothetical protein